MGAFIEYAFNHVGSYSKESVKQDLNRNKRILIIPGFVFKVQYLLQCDVGFAERLVLKDGVVKSYIECVACVFSEKGTVTHFMEKGLS